MNDRYLRLFLPLVLFGAALLDCKGGDRAPTLGNGDVPGGGRGGNGSLGGEGGTGAGPSDAGLDATVSNCGELSCRGAGKCVLVDNHALCLCDPGYVLSGDECVVDETCIRLRILEESCRQRIGGQPALGMFFDVETCAGTTVRPDILGDVSQAFTVIEDGNELGEESFATVIERDVEAYVAIAIDLSGSLVTDQNLLVPLIGRLKTMVASLEPAPGEPPVSVALIAFGRSVHVVREFTSDFAALASTLDSIQADPTNVVAEPNGTNLYGAVNLGVQVVSTVMQERFSATLGAVVSTGTLVTITDGRDTASAALLPANNRVNLISIGISDDINDEELSRIGAQGSFLAPSPSDWAGAFARVAARVSEYPDRAYLLGYCSPAVEGDHQVVVTLKDRPARDTASCAFEAETFGIGVATCNAGYINDYCSAHSCGTFLACGACETDAGPPTQRSEDDIWGFASVE